jgi:hypothetical protein
MPNYQDAKIYKLINTEGALCYIGSTTQKLSLRKAHHYNHYKRWKNDKGLYLTSFKIFEDDEFGCKIILIEAFPCNSKEELEKRERYYIENTECVNKCRPTRTIQEWRSDNKDIIKQYHVEYYQKNKDKLRKKESDYVDCECGSKYPRYKRCRHNRSQKHIKYMSLLIQN